MKSLLIIITALFLLTGCNNTKKETYVSKTETVKPEQIHPGKKLMETNCYICHSPTASHDERTGPPMVAIKKHYINDDITKEEFIEAIQSWIKNPTEENAKMFGAVKRFGVMPKTPYPDETVKQIADYMFDNDIDQPEWFEEHFNEERGKGKGMQHGKGKGKGNGNGKGKQKQQAQINLEDLPYRERGLKYALSTKAILGKNLMGTIQKKGTLEALAFCNEKAYPLTDSMSLVHNAIIKRVSDKPRNPNNQANLQELEYIKTFKKVVSNNEEPKPIVNQLDSQIKVYYPITTNSMCLQCHGKPNDNIEPKILNSLTELYPNDKAIGYDVNQVRGVWSVTFSK